MAKEHKISRDEQEKADMEKMQKRVENMLPPKAEIPAAISIQQAEELKARISELEARLAQSAASGKNISITEQEMMVQLSSVKQAKESLANPTEQLDKSGKLNLWQKLVKPHAVITNVAEQRQSSLVSTLLLVLILAISSGPFVQVYVLHDLTIARLLVGMDLGFGIAYILSRTKGYQLAVPILLTVLAVWPIQSIVLGKNYTQMGLLTTFIFDVLFIILSGTFASFRTTIFLSAANFLGILLLPILLPVVQFETIVIPLIFNGLVSALILVLTRHRNLVEIERLEEVNKVNRILQTNNAILNDRTRELNLASEVGRTISQKVENISVMLTEATEMIRSRFNLYYIQVYLLDPSGKTITLRAGTGRVGQQLLQRGHHLFISSGSLNGRAVSEKKPVIVADTEQSGTFLPNPLLPNTRSEMAIPLLVGDKVLGVLDMQSEFANALNEDNLAAFQVLAGQLSVAIQNAALFTQSEEARKQVEDNVRQIATVGWQDFLNGSDRGEKIGYVFDQTEVKPIERKSKTRSKNALNIPITVTGTTVGTIQVAQDEREWTSNETQIVQSTADQLAQHIENLRLLSQAEKYRQEAEQTTRRLTREGWEGYLQTRNALAEVYSFDPNEVKTLDNSIESEPSLTQTRPITVRDETIGELMVNADHVDSEEMNEIFSAVAAQLGDHIENLRLLETTQHELAERTRTEQELLKVRLGMDRTNDAVFITETDGTIVYINPAFERIYGWKAEEAIGQTPRILKSGVIPAEQYTHFWTALKNNQVVTGEIVNKTKDGRLIPIEGNNNPIVDSDGKIIGFLGMHRDITERKQAEERLHLAQQRAQNILESVTLPMVITRLKDNTLTFINQPATEVVHMKYEDVINQPAPNFYYDIEERAKFISDLRARGEVSNMTVQLLRGNGEKFWALISARMFEYQGEPSILSTFMDITDRIRAEEAIKAEQQRAQTILETVSVPMIISRLSDSTVLYANQALSQFRHVPLEELIGARTSDYFVNPNDRVKLVEILKQQSLVTDFETQLHRKDGVVSSVLLSARIIKYQDEMCVLTTYVDITDRIHAQEVIIKRAAELQTVAEVSITTATTFEPDRLLQAVVDLSKEKFDLYHAHIYLADESWNTLLLAAGAGEIGRQMVNTGHAIQMDTERSLVARATRERKAIIVNNVRSEPNFLPNPMLPETRAEMAVPMIAGDKVIGVFDVQSELEGRFTQEDASIFTTLASQAAVALQNARLYMEQAATVTQLRELDRLKSSFLANMSHELRTPLNSILGFADVMLEELDGPLTENMNTDLGLIQKNGQHLLHLINDVLDMAKIDSGKMNLNVEKFNVHELLTDVTSYTSSLAKEKSLALVIETDSDREVEINADKVRLRQVMINLVNNAMKFTEKGQVTICAVREENNILISIEDTGIGIPADHLEAVFQEFTQVDTTTTRKTGGTGLGLPISRRLINMHSGRLWAESTGINGEGSTFYVSLPIEANINEEASLAVK